MTMLSAAEMVVTVAGLAVISALSRSAFFLSGRPWRLPAWAERGLRYAPLAALAAVVAPELVLVQGHWPDSWRDARFFAAPAAALWAYWRRDMLTTIAVGMAVFLGCRLVAGW